MTGWAIDLGSTQSAVARWDEEAERPRLVELPQLQKRPGGDLRLDVPALVPSATEALARPDLGARLAALLGRPHLGGRRALIGEPAVQRNLGEPHPAYVRSFKEALARDPLQILGRARGRTLTARETARLFLRELLRALRREAGGRVRELVVTTPIEAYEGYRAELAAAARQLGVRRLRLLDEPVAAAVGYQLGLRTGRRVLVVDFGASSLDVALVRLDPRELEAGRCRVLGKAGRRLGGDRVDAWLLERFCERLGYPLDGRDATPEAPHPAGSDEAEAVWHRLMLDEARRVKEAVHFDASATFDRMPPEELRRFDARLRGEAGPLTVRRDEVAEILRRRGLYDTLGACLDEALAAGGGEEPDEVLLVGGSTLLPGVYERVAERFGRSRVRGWKPFHAVAWGASAWAAGRVHQSDVLAHDYALLWWERERHEPRHHVVIPRGTRVPTAPDHWRGRLVPTCARGEHEQLFKLVISEIGRAEGDEERLLRDASGRLHVLGGRRGEGDEAALVVPLNAAEPVLGRLDPPHPPDDDRPRIELAFGVDAERWLIATARDLWTRRLLLDREPVIRLL